MASAMRGAKRGEDLKCSWSVRRTSTEVMPVGLLTAMTMVLLAIQRAMIEVQ
jgi:hypothetical protein